RLGTRIAAMALAVLLAIQALNAAVFFLLSHPPTAAYSARWLSNKTEEAAVAVFGADVKERPFLARRLCERKKLDILWWQLEEQERPPSSSPRPASLAHLRASLAKELEGKIRRVAVVGRSGPPEPALGSESRYWPSDLIERLPAERIGAVEEVPVFSQFH